MHEPRHIMVIFKKVSAYLILAMSIPLFFIGLNEKNPQLTSAAVLMAWLFFAMINYSRERVMLFAFSLTFFVFLLGELFVSYFDKTKLYDEDLKSLLHTYKCLYVSIISIYVGACIGLKIKFKFEEREAPPKPVNANEIESIRTACKILFLFCAICSLAIAVEKLYNVRLMGSYTATFIEYHSVLPSFVSKMDDMTDMFFFLYLATLPDPRKSKLFFGLKLLIAGLLLLYGMRNVIVLTVLMIALYCIFYEDANGKRYSVIPKWVYGVTALVMPIAFVFFDYVMSIRDGYDYSFGGVFSSLKRIADSLGGSVNVITYGYDFREMVPDKMYSFGNIKSFLTQNFISRAIWGTEVYQGNTAEMALYGNSFSHTITYLVKRSSYLAGYGMGSCYIAEAFHDFGMAGVIAFNVGYGWILSKFTKMIPNAMMKNTIILMASYNILFAPRSYADGFISCFFNFSFLFALVVLYVMKRAVQTGHNLFIKSRG